MLFTLQQVVAEIEVPEGELSAWIERRWVLPVRQEGRYLFDEADRARIALIAELRRDLEIDEDAIPVVLQLLDQLYGLRRTLNELRRAIQELPAETRAELDERLRRQHRPT